MKRIILLSPVPLSREQYSGITIRIDQIAKWFKSMGLSVKKTDHLSESLLAKDRLFYALVSTKKSSISSQIAQKLTENQKLIIDLYTPLFLEKALTFSKFNLLDFIKKQRQKFQVKQILHAGSHYLVANSRQKSYWLKSFRQLDLPIKKTDISVVSTGSPLFTSNQPPVINRRVILWFGGIYPWMNPLPLVEAFSKIASRNPKWKLRFLGGFHPQTGYYHLYQNVIRYAQRLIRPSQLEIIPWQKFKNLAKDMKDVSLAIHLAKKTKEDYYAHRVRLLTLANAGIAVLTNGQDVISDLIIKYGAGEKVHPKNLKDQLELVMNSPSKLVRWSKNAIQIQSLYLKKESEIFPFF